MSTKSFPKLYSLTDSEFKAYSSLTHDGKILTTPADNIPMIFWPDGRWCLEANLYMAKLFDAGLSRDERGGTLHTYATQISHLLRFCFGLKSKKPYFSSESSFSGTKICLHELTDNDFSTFISTLIAEKKSESGAAKRQSNSNINIGRRCLEFLEFVGEFHRIENFIGPGGQIVAEKKVTHIRTAGKIAIRSRFYWHHRALPVAGPMKRRLPISADAIDSLHQVVYKVSSTTYLRKRRYLMLTLLEATGGRRSEIASLTIESVQKAASMEQPFLELPTKKKGASAPPTRFVPIQRSVFNQIVEFVEKNRKPLMRRLGKTRDDPGVVLVSETDGSRLTANTITTEIYLLRKAAGLVGRAHPHMFRHTFITRLFKALVEQHNFGRTEELRNYLFDGEKLKREIAEWTGHSNLQSLEIYLHLAFEGTSDHSSAIDTLVAASVIKNVLRSISEIQEELKKITTKSTLNNCIQSFSSLLNSACSDLEAIRSGDR